MSDISNARSTQISSKNADELVERNGSTVIAIKFSKERFSLVLVHVNTEVLKTVHQLCHVDLSVSIIINDSEDTSKSTNGHRSTAKEVSLNIGHDLISRLNLCLGNSVSSRIL